MRVKLISAVLFSLSGKYILPDHGNVKQRTFTGCALTNRYFTKCETDCRVAKNKCSCVATLAKHRFSIHRNAPGSFFPPFQNGVKIPAIS